MKWIAAFSLILLTQCMKPVEKFEFLPFGQVIPEGWILDQLNQNLDGYTGHLDSLVPDLTTEDEIYGSNRLTLTVKDKNVGNIREHADWEIQYLWWNSETQSNWRDGYIRTAILTNRPDHLEKAADYVKKVLATQDSDGYLGIYDRDLRYRFTDENGELWAKATLLRGLLGWYEADPGSRQPVLDAVVNAVEELMRSYPIHESEPFKVEKSFAGVCHGLMITDVLDRLQQLTGRKKFGEYAAFLYEDYSSHPLMEEDVKLDNILNKNYKLKGHGVHTYEHLRSLAVAWYNTGDPRIGKALKVYLSRIDSVTTPSGGPVGDEWIGGRMADPEETGYEYCSIHELLDSYTLLLQKTGDPGFADKAEKIFFNAAQGARHPGEHAIAYLKTDNSWQMTGPLNDTVPQDKQTRYKYSPVHQDVAVCCVPNAGRIGPAYVRSMWMRTPNGFAATLYGPSVMETLHQGKKVRIVQETGYPEEYKITFRIQLGEPIRMKLKFRIPEWCSEAAASVPTRLAGGYLVANKVWRDGDTVELTLKPETVLRSNGRGDFWFTYGPLVLALPVEGTQSVTKEYPVQGFRDLAVKATTKKVYTLDGNPEIRQLRKGELLFQVKLLDPVTRSKVDTLLVPVGNTLLRQVSFRKNE